MPLDLLVGRVAGAGLLVWMGWIHLHLWSAGYKHLPSIGNLFLLNFIGAVVLAVGVLVAPRRYLALVAGAGALMVAGTLVSLIISINVGLLGFKDSFAAPSPIRVCGWRSPPWWCWRPPRSAACRSCACDLSRDRAEDGRAAPPPGGSGSRGAVVARRSCSSSSPTCSPGRSWRGFSAWPTWACRDRSPGPTSKSPGC